MRAFTTLLVLITIGLFTGCSGNVAEGEPSVPDETVAASDASTTYDVRGRIVEIRDGGATLVVDHEEIPGYMEAMTMPFEVGDSEEVDGVDVGDAISFTYVDMAGGMWIEGIEKEAGSSVSASPSADAEPEYGEPAQGSVYWLDHEWTTQQGKTLRLTSFEGQPVIVGMIFTNCGFACPMIVRDMKRIGAQVAETDGVQYLLVSLDPDRDSPEQLARFASAHRLDSDRWTLLRGSKNQVRMLAAALGIRYRKESDGQFAHSNLISILDASGEVVHQQRGLDNDGKTSADVLAALLPR
ncbi:MAG: SCO family protein [Bacteroidota bacterium]